MAANVSAYTPEIGDRICLGLMEGLSMPEVLKAPGMPGKSTVYGWLQTNPEFKAKYREAREAQMYGLADDLMDIANDGRNDWMERNGKDGTPGYVLNGEHVQRSRLRIDTIKFLLAKMLPKEFGDTVKAEISGPNGGPIEVKDTDLARRALLLLAKLTNESTGDK
jgi:hypothetical protein